MHNPLEPITQFRGPTRWLSNFHYVTVYDEGKPYSTTEHAYQARKLLDPNLREMVRNCDTPRDAMLLGRKLHAEGVGIDPNWDDNKLGAMEFFLRQKYSYPDLRARLVDTVGHEIIEGNTWGDTFWGQCPIGNGQNWLGKITMKIRDEALQEA